MMKVSEDTEKQISQSSVKQLKVSKGLNALEKFICIIAVCLMLPITAFFSFMDLMVMDSLSGLLNLLILFIWFLPLPCAAILSDKSSKYTFLFFCSAVAWVMIFPILLPFVLGWINH